MIKSVANSEYVLIEKAFCIAYKHQYRHGQCKANPLAEPVT